VTEAMLKARHGQARWLAQTIVEAGPALPSRRKWASLHKLAEDFLKLMEGDRP